MCIHISGRVRVRVLHMHVSTSAGLPTTKRTRAQPTSHKRSSRACTFTSSWRVLRLSTSSCRGTKKGESAGRSRIDAKSLQKEDYSERSGEEERANAPSSHDSYALCEVFVTACLPWAQAQTTRIRNMLAIIILHKLGVPSEHRRTLTSRYLGSNFLCAASSS